MSHPPIPEDRCGRDRREKRRRGNRRRGRRLFSFGNRGSAARTYAGVGLHLIRAQFTGGRHRWFRSCKDRPPKPGSLSNSSYELARRITHLPVESAAQSFPSAPTPRRIQNLHHDHVGIQRAQIALVLNPPTEHGRQIIQRIVLPLAERRSGRQLLVAPCSYRTAPGPRPP